MYTRRDVLRLLGGVCAVGTLTPEQLLGVGVTAHRRIALTGSPLGFFDAHQLHTVGAACDRILPETETPGALVAGCHRFAELIVAEHYAPPRQKRFLDGLVNLDTRASRTLHQLFVEVGTAEQDAVLAAVERDALDAPAGGGSFWRDLKELTLIGFYTSRIGIEDELAVNFYPGSFDGCAPLPSGQS